MKANRYFTYSVVYAANAEEAKKLGRIIQDDGASSQFNLSTYSNTDTVALTIDYSYPADYWNDWAQRSGVNAWAFNGGNRVNFGGN